MLLKKSIVIIILGVFGCILTVKGQRVKKYDLVKLLHENQLDTSYNANAQLITDANHRAITVTGVVFLRDINFKNGTIDVDLRGKDVFLKSFLGIAFHAKDTSAYDVIYFRPFRF